LATLLRPLTLPRLVCTSLGLSEPKEIFMALKKVSTFKRTVTWKEPGEELDSSIDQSYVAEFNKFDPIKFKQMIDAKPNDMDFVRAILRSADGNSDIGEVLSNGHAVHATAAKYIEAIKVETPAKNSAT
jgi:hypothetical protein